jgi:hypothetical protein
MWVMRILVINLPVRQPNVNSSAHSLSVHSASISVVKQSLQVTSEIGFLPKHSSKYFPHVAKALILKLTHMWLPFHKTCILAP